MNAPFDIKPAPKIHFGIGASKKIANLLGATASRVLLLRGGSGIASAPIAHELARLPLDFKEAAISGEPSVDTINGLFTELKEQPFDAIIACGGGAVIDSGKALRFCFERQELLPVDLQKANDSRTNCSSTTPLIAIPTTAGTGAEVTANAVLQSGHAKTSVRGDHLIPDMALVDPHLLASAPNRVVLGAGLDALVQTMEAYTSCKATPYTDALVLDRKSVV